MNLMILSRNDSVYQDITEKGNDRIKGDRIMRREIRGILRLVSEEKPVLVRIHLCSSVL